MNNVTYINKNLTLGEALQRYMDNLSQDERQMKIDTAIISFSLDGDGSFASLVDSDKIRIVGLLEVVKGCLLSDEY